MRAIFWLAFGFLAAFATNAYSQTPQGVSQAEEAGLAWVTAVDEGHIDASWQQAAAMFRTAMTQADWDSKIRAAREPLGKVKGRTLQSATAPGPLSGAPAGDYVIITYQTQFERKETGIETVAVVHEMDGTWHVAGYSIR
jgi:hypothetical protein